MVLTIAATLFILQSKSYALDVTLQWDANTEEDLAGYLVYYDTDAGDPYTPDTGGYAIRYSVDGGTTWADITDAPPIIVSSNVTEIILQGLNNDKDYFFAVKVL
jgi:hypothetical protein